MLPVETGGTPGDRRNLPAACMIAVSSGFRPACIRYSMMAVYGGDEDQRRALARIATLKRERLT
jgi:hypothetical protein